MIYGDFLWRIDRRKAHARPDGRHGGGFERTDAAIFKTGSDRSSSVPINSA
jgi:hypothetical protein